MLHTFALHDKFCNSRVKYREKAKRLFILYFDLNNTIQIKHHSKYEMFDSNQFVRY